MTRGRRALLLLALAALLGGLAASDVAQREAAIAARVGDPVDVVVARRDIAAGTSVRAGDLAVRGIPARFAPPGAASVPAELIGARLAVRVPRGAPLGPALVQVERAVAVGRGERAVEVVGVGSPELVVPGARVDVLVTGERADGTAGQTALALAGVEVLSARPAEQTGGELPSITATLRVSARQAVALAGELADARAVRLLPRPAG